MFVFYLIVYSFIVCLFIFRLFICFVVYLSVYGCLLQLLGISTHIQLRVLIPRTILPIHGPIQECVPKESPAANSLLLSE